MIGATPWQTFVKQARSPGFSPFVIGFGTVLGFTLYGCRIKDDTAYLNTTNPRFAAPFIKRAGLDKKPEDAQ